MEKHRRSLAKAISWRATGTVRHVRDLVLVFSGSVKLAGGIASVEVVTKMVLYYLHERVWSGISGGARSSVDAKQPAAGEWLLRWQEAGVAERADPLHGRCLR